MNLSLVNSLCYTIGWFWCVLLGIQGYSLLVLTGTFSLIVFQLYYTKIHDLSLYIQDLILLSFSIPLGFILEFIFIQTNTLRYGESGGVLPPLWIVLLYPLFSLLLNHSLSILKKHEIAAFLLGFLGAPLSYLAGVSLGGVTFLHSLLVTWMVVGVSWGLFLCLLVKIARIVENAAEKTLEERDSISTLTLLYDGECPICKREICLLKKIEKRGSIEFIDISSKDFLKISQNIIDYETAMKEIHAVEGNGKLLAGVEVFAAVYARCGLLVTSTLLRIPFIEKILTPFYRLFAKNRMRLTGR